MGWDVLICGRRWRGIGEFFEGKEIMFFGVFKYINVLEVWD